MRYLKVFWIPLLFMIIVSIIICASRYKNPKENSEETLDNSSSYLTNFYTNETPKEEVINVKSESVNSERNVSIIPTVYASSSQALKTTTKEPKTAIVDKTETLSNSQPVQESINNEPAPTVGTSVEQNTSYQTNINKSDGVIKSVPGGRGYSHTIMGWQLITCKTSNQYKLREQAGENYDENGFAKINGRFVVATKPYFGKVGDYIDIYKSNGEIINCIIGDQKGSDGGGDMYGHADGSIVEFIVDKYRWYSRYNGKGRYLTVGEFYPQWTSSSITQIVNLGNYWE